MRRESLSPNGVQGKVNITQRQQQHWKTAYPRAVPSVEDITSVALLFLLSAYTQSALVSVQCKYQLQHFSTSFACHSTLPTTTTPPPNSPTILPLFWVHSHTNGITFFSLCLLCVSSFSLSLFLLLLAAAVLVSKQPTPTVPTILSRSERELLIS